MTSGDLFNGSKADIPLTVAMGNVCSIFDFLRFFVFEYEPVRDRGTYELARRLMRPIERPLNYWTKIAKSFDALFSDDLSCYGKSCVHCARVSFHSFFVTHVRAIITLRA